MNVNATNGQGQPKAAPTWLKTGLIALVIFIIVFIFIYSSYGDSDDSSEAISPVDNTLLDEKRLDSTLNVDADKYNSNSLLAIESQARTNIEADTLKHSEQILAIEENAKINNKQISLILEQLQKLQSDLIKIPAQFDSQAIENESIKESIVSMQVTVAKHEEKLIKKAQARSKKIPRHKIKKIPPFILVSIDQWGDDLIAIVRYHMQLQEMRLGQELDQWSVKNIDINNSTVTFSHSSGASNTLAIKS